MAAAFSQIDGVLFDTVLSSSTLQTTSIGVRGLGVLMMSSIGVGFLVSDFCIYLTL